MALTCDIAIVGGGVLGLCVAVELAARGHGVAVLDPGERNASSVAAGMIAPAMESILDGVTPERAHLMREAAALWPPFAHRLSIDLMPGPAEWRGDAQKAFLESADRLGFAVEVRDGAVWTHDQRVEPEAAMAALRASAGRTMTCRATSVVRSGSGWSVNTTEGAVEARHLVLATGASTSLKGLPDPIATIVDSITPIRGQIGWLDSAFRRTVTRGYGGYVAPLGHGTVMGASMGVGRRDLAFDADDAAAMLATAEGLTGRDLRTDTIDWRVGIRGATADGLPLAGPTDEPGLHLALAPRRNGWLLGPLVGQVVADGIESRHPPDHASALDPHRFSRQAG